MDHHLPLCIAALVFALPSVAAAVEPLPEGHSGIAAGYLGDAGIGDDPQVVFADDFEDYASPDELQSRWDNVYHFENISLVAGEEGYDGSQSVRLTLPTQSSEVSNELMKNVEPAVDVLFLRYYSKYDLAFDIEGSSHNGSTMSASYWDGPGSGPGIAADGTNKFLVNLEVGRFESRDPMPGWLNVYIYHPEQRDVLGRPLLPHGDRRADHLAAVRLRTRVRVAPCCRARLQLPEASRPGLLGGSCSWSCRSGVGARRRDGF